MATFIHSADQTHVHCLQVLAGTFAVAGLAQALPSNTAYAYSVNIAHSPHTEFHSACIAKATDAKHISAFGQVAAALYRWVLASLAAALATAASLRHAAHSIYNEVLVLTRGIFLLLLFTPAVCMAPLPGLLGMALAAPAAALRAYAERAGVSQPAAAAAAAGVPAQAAALTASCVAVAAAPCSSAAQREADTAGPGPSSLAQQRQRDMPQASVGSKRRLPQAALTLAVIFESAPGAGRESWLRLVKWTLERAGPAFIKWGQWASTRPDLFAKDLCDTLEQLQTAAPSHPGAFSRAAVESALGEPVEILFATFEDVPIASGSIAQIHRATLSALGAARTGCPEGSVVAVKVRHPGVSNLMHRDFILMVRAAALCAKLPGLSELRLEESIRQFGGPLKEQLDLSVEAQHLTRFNTNFASWGNVTFPQPLYPLVAPSVLVESFEEGQLISRYVRTPGRLNVSLARGGVTLFLKMMLGDNFIHADLHPGNILVREVPGPAWMQPEGRVGQAIWHMARSVLWVLPTRVRAWLPADVIMSFEPRIVLLDSGMIVSLSPDDQRALKKFFSALTRLDGEGLGRAILALSENASSYSAYTSQPSAKPLRPSAGAAAAATAKAAAAQASHIPTSATEAMSGSHSTMRSSTAVPEVSTATGALRSVVSSHRSGSGTAANAIGSDATSSSSSRAGVGSSSTAASEAPESGVLVQLGSCKDPEGFIEAMKDLFADVDTEVRINLFLVLQPLLPLALQSEAYTVGGTYACRLYGTVSVCFSLRWLVTSSMHQAKSDASVAMHCSSGIFVKKRKMLLHRRVVVAPRISSSFFIV